MARRISDFEGHRVRLSLVRPLEVHGVRVQRLEGVFGVQGMAFTLGDITAASGPDADDVIEAAKLLHGAIVGDMRNVIAVESPTPVHHEDDDEDL